MQEPQKRTIAVRPQRRTIALTLTALLITLFLIGMSFSPLGSPQRAQAATWSQIWSDEFNASANTGANTTNWQYDLGTSYPGGAGNWGTGEIETMTNSTANVYHDGSGHLAIKPINNGGNWTSGRIETVRTNFGAAAGGQAAIEASIQMPNVTGAAAQGYWPAFWMLGSSFRGVYTNWPIAGEIDVMENVNGVNTEYATLHCGVSPGGPCNETSGLGGNRTCSPSSCQAAFHTYRVEIDRSVSPEVIRWYLDGVQFWQVYSNHSGMDANTWANAVDHNFFVILNVAMGGSWPGNPSASTQSGAAMLVDYVRVFTSGGGTPPTPTSTTGSTPTATSTSSTCPSGSFRQGVVNVNSSSAKPWFQACGWTAGYVILHYIIPALPQQNINMAYNSGATRWEYTVNSFTAGQNVQYSFTYQKGGLQYDTGWYSWTHP